MGTTHGNRHDAGAQQARTDQPEPRATLPAGGEQGARRPDESESDDLNRWLRHLDACESGPWTTGFQLLTDAGVHLPEPESLDDEALTSKLWEVIRELAKMRVFLSETDHLSDRQLYTRLWGRMLREDVPLVPMPADAASHLSVLGGWSNEDNSVYLKYYADEEWRDRWRVEFPRDIIPAHEDPPFDRDRHLPQPD
jgi:hypothetical protein